jgi:type II secretory pathway pseudopilin PulG
MPRSKKVRVGRLSGFTRLEFVVSIALITFMSAILLNRLHYYQEMAERAAMESTLRLIKTGLQIRVAELISANQQAQAVALEKADPLQWLDPKPPNYAGQYRVPAEAGNWYFDAANSQLVYVVNISSHLQTDGDAPKNELRFRTRVLREKLPYLGSTLESVTGVTLSPAVSYRWSASIPCAILAS